MRVERFQKIQRRFDRIRQPDAQRAARLGEEIVVTGSGNCSPLALSTSTTFALIIRFRYVAEMTRFSSSTKFDERNSCAAMDEMIFRTVFLY
jgi:hypothetical protein